MRRKTTRNCHGIKLHQLKCLTQRRPAQLRTDALSFTRRYFPGRILSADEQINSDVNAFTKGWGMPYTNISLPKWIERIHKPSHMQANRAKTSQSSVAGINCPYNTLHHPTITVGKKNKAPTESQVAKSSNGSHCSFYDIYELYLYPNTSYGNTARIAPHLLY